VLISTLDYFPARRIYPNAEKESKLIWKKQRNTTYGINMLCLRLIKYSWTDSSVKMRRYSEVSGWRQSLKRQKTFASWRCSLPENISLNSVATKASRLYLFTLQQLNRLTDFHEKQCFKPPQISCLLQSVNQIQSRCHLWLL